MGKYIKDNKTYYNRYKTCESVEEIKMHASEDKEMALLFGTIMGDSTDDISKWIATIEEAANRAILGVE